MGRLKWENADEYDSQFGINLSEESDVERHKIIVNHKIMNLLLLNPNGLGIRLLAKLVGIDRKNLKSYLRRLIEIGYVKKNDGLRGKYFASEKIIKNPILSSALMAESFDSDLLGKPN